MKEKLQPILIFAQKSKHFLLLLLMLLSINVANAQCFSSNDCDGDGVLNSVDLDDDNDGILDTDEASSTVCQTFTFTNSDQVVTVPSNAIGMKVKIWGAGGGHEIAGTGPAGVGGYTYVEFGSSIVIPGSKFTLVVGSGGNRTGRPNELSPAAVYGFGAIAGHEQGGGLSGVFTGSATVLETDMARALAIAGGGAGYENSGGSSGAEGYNGNSSTSGGQPNMRGATDVFATSPCTVIGVTSAHFASGGGGFSGGGRIATLNSNYSNVYGTCDNTIAAARGGSGYFSSSAIVSSILFTPDLTINTPPNNTDPAYIGGVGVAGTLASQAGGNGLIQICWIIDIDTDGDGITDRIDLDSDNDGCSDANEAYNSNTAQGTDGNMYYGNGNPPAVGATGTVTTASYAAPNANYTNSLVSTACITANPDNVNTTQGTASTGSLTTNDVSLGSTYTVSVTQPSPSTGTITLNPSTGQYTFTPNPSYVGTGSTTYTVCNTAGCSTTSINYTVTGTAPVAVADATTTTQGTPVSGGLGTNDTGAGAINSPTFTVTQPSPSTGTITINPSTGQYTFTPNPSYVGTGSTTYTLCNNTGSCSATTISYTVTGTAPVAVADATTTTQGTPVSGGLGTNDTGAGAINSPTFTVTQPSPSTGTITINPSTGQYTFTPNPSYVGTGSTTYTLCNNTGSCSATTITYSVTGTTPLAASDATTTTQGTPVSGGLGTNDTGAGAINSPTFTVTQPSPTTGTITINPSTGQYTFTPNPSFVGTGSTSYTLCNNTGSCSATTITFTVFPTLVANPDVITTTPSVTTTGTLTTNDGGVVPGGTYSVSVNQPAPTTGTITVNPSTGQYTFTPNPAFTGTASTTYTVCNTAVNPNVCSTSTISITVSNVPVAVSDGTTTIQNTPASGNVGTNDTGANPSLNPVFTGGPVAPGTGTLTINPSTGAYSYTPATGFTGTTSATYTLCNISSPPCSTTTITFTVFPTLVANPDVITTTPSVTTTGTLTTNDGGVVPGGTYSVSVTQPAPTTGTITVNPSTGQYTFTPNPTYTGSTTTTYTVCNTAVNPIVCSSSTITINVGNVPVAVSDGTTTMQNTPASGNVATNDTGANPSLNPVFTGGPVAPGTGTLTINPSTGAYSYTPATGFTGTTSATYTLCNISSPPCSTTTITFTVFPTLVANPDVITTTPSVTTTGTLTTNDGGVVPGGTYSVSVTQPAPTTGTITVNPSTGQYTFTPNPTYTGSTTTTYTVCNTAVNPIVCSSSTITINVGNAQIAVAKRVVSTIKTSATTYQSVFSFNVANLGNTVGTNVQLVDNLNNTFPTPITYTVVGVTANSPLTTNATYNGNTVIAMLSGTNSLNPLQSSIVTLTVSFSPNSTTLTALSNSGIGSTSNNPDPTGTAPHTSTDITDTGTNPDPDGDGNPNEPGENDPTTFGQQVAGAKTASALTKINATTYQTVFTFNVANVGPVAATNVQLTDNLNNTFPAPMTYTVVGLNANSPLTTNAGYNGNTNIALLSGNNRLNISQRSVVTLTVNFSPNSSTVTSLSNIGIVSSSNAPDPTGGGTHTSIDTTDAGTNPDFDGDGNPNEPGENTPTHFGQQIGVAKSALSTIKLDNGDNQTTFVFTVQNLGVVPATNVQLTDNLNSTFPAPITYNISSLIASSGLTTNSTYNGGSNINLLTGTNTLAVGATGTVTLVVNYNMNGSSLTKLYNTGVATTSDAGGTISSDTTNTGNTPDTNGNGNPNEPGENTPTSFEPIPDVIPNTDFSIPQGFSPNGDGVNDLFVIKGLSAYPNSKLTILNRWGNVVYKMDSYDNTWNGKSSEGFRYGGDDLPEGTYFYILDLGNGEKPYKGYIYLNKTVK